MNKILVIKGEGKIYARNLHVLETFCKVRHCDRNKFWKAIKLSEVVLKSLNSSIDIFAKKV